MKRSCHPILTDGKFAKSNPFHFKTTHKRLIFNYFKELLIRFNGTAMISISNVKTLKMPLVFRIIGASEPVNVLGKGHVKTLKKTLAFRITGASEPVNGWGNGHVKTLKKTLAFRIIGASEPVNGWRSGKKC